MTDTPMTPEELAKVTRDARAWVERPSFSKKGWIDALCLALLQERARAKALAALVYELEPDARRWRAVRESARSTTVSWGTNDPAHSGSRTEWQITAWLHGDTIDEAADRLADKEGA
jgi:hypothetical protein